MGIRCGGTGVELRNLGGDNSSEGTGLCGEEGRGRRGVSAAQCFPGHSREGKSWKSHLAVAALGSFMLIICSYSLWVMGLP